MTAVGDRPLYVTFDVDGIDPAFAPGTGTPVPGGLTAREALQLLRGMAGARLVGMDLVEVSPGARPRRPDLPPRRLAPLRGARPPRVSGSLSAGRGPRPIDATVALIPRSERAPW